VACLNKFTTAPKELMDKVLKAAIKRNETKELSRLSETMFPTRKRCVSFLHARAVINIISMMII